MFKRLDAKWKALCLARPKTLAAVFFTLATGMLFFYLHMLWGTFAMWILAAVLLPVPFEVWAMVRRNRRGSNPLPRRDRPVF